MNLPDDRHENFHLTTGTGAPRDQPARDAVNLKEMCEDVSMWKRAAEYWKVHFDQATADLEAMTKKVGGIEAHHHVFYKMAASYYYNYQVADLTEEKLSEFTKKHNPGLHDLIHGIGERLEVMRVERDAAVVQLELYQRYLDPEGGLQLAKNLQATVTRLRGERDAANGWAKEQIHRKEKMSSHWKGECDRHNRTRATVTRLRGFVWRAGNLLRQRDPDTLAAIRALDDAMNDAALATPSTPEAPDAGGKVWVCEGCNRVIDPREVCTHVEQGNVHFTLIGKPCGPVKLLSESEAVAVPHDKEARRE